MSDDLKIMAYNQRRAGLNELERQAKERRRLVDELIRIHQPHCWKCGKQVPGPLGHGNAVTCEECKEGDAER